MNSNNLLVQTIKVSLLKFKIQICISFSRIVRRSPSQSSKLLKGSTFPTLGLKSANQNLEFRMFLNLSSVQLSENRSIYNSIEPVLNSESDIIGNYPTSNFTVTLFSISVLYFIFIPKELIQFILRILKSFHSIMQV